MSEKIQVSVVEDRQHIRESLVLLINSSDYCICLDSFEDGESALIKIPEILPDIVLMDIDLPGIDGIECIRKLKKICPGTQFMICSIYDEDEKIFEALTAGANSYILKRSGSEELISAILDLHNGGSPMSSDIARKLVMHFQRTPFNKAEEFKLTKREVEILEQLSKGYSYQQVADNIFISPKTLKKHVYNIYEKLHVNSRTEALNKFYGR
jgi:DNA-binding NarL/FixJ family response regulator